MKKYIRAAYGDQIPLAKIFGVSQRTVYSALKMLSNSERAKKIRATALLRGGVLYEEKPATQLKPIS